MGKNKLKKFNDNKVFANVIEPSRDEVLSSKFDLKGNWSEQIFKNKNPIVLELGCGKGEYSVDLAKRNPDKNFIGVDIKGARFWHGAKIALDEDITNVRFLRTQIELIENCFERNEISEIWITFPDPQIKYKREKHRLTNPEFLAKYKNILQKEGFVHLKTDSEFMHGYTLGVLRVSGFEIVYSNHDIYNTHREFFLENPELLPVVEVQTHYEKIYLEKEKPITYIKFRF